MVCDITFFLTRVSNSGGEYDKRVVIVLVTTKNIGVMLLSEVEDPLITITTFAHLF